MTDPESRDFEPKLRDTTLVDVANTAFIAGSSNRQGFELTTFNDSIGFLYEKVEYSLPYGIDGQETSVTIIRPTIHTAEFQTRSGGTIDESPQVYISVLSPRTFMFDLENREKYFCLGAFRVVQLSNGPHLDMSMPGFYHDLDEDTGNVLQTHTYRAGSVFRPLPSRTDSVIQDIIDPNQA